MRKLKLRWFFKMYYHILTINDTRVGTGTITENAGTIVA